MKRNLSVGVICMLLGATIGCNWLVPFVFIGEHKKTVAAEFSKLNGKRAMVLVWAEPATLFDYPYVRRELATYISDKIEAGVEDCQLIDPARVEDYLQRSLNADIDPAKTGKHFDAEYVIYIELLTFQIRDPSTPDLVQGRIKASITAYDLTVDPDESSRFVLAPVSVSCPEHQPILMSSRNALLIRQQTYEKFSETVARKFFDHKIDL